MKKQKSFCTRGSAAALIVLSMFFLLCMTGCAKQNAEQNEVPSSAKLLPKDVLSWEKPYDDGAVTFDFQHKYELRQWPEAAYGFWEKLELKEPAVVTQYVENDIGMEHVKFGIYKDPALQQSIDEADVGYNLKARWAFEEGGDLDDYPEYKPYLRMVLEPGTYYMAVYTTKKSDDFLLSYISWCCTIENDIQLQPGETAYFLGDANEETYFRVDVNAAGEIIVEPNGFAGKLSLCSEDKEIISEEVTVSEEMRKKQDAVFPVEKAGTYYLRLRDYPDSYTEAYNEDNRLYMNHIIYSFKTE